MKTLTADTVMDEVRHWAVKPWALPPMWTSEADVQRLFRGNFRDLSAGQHSHQQRWGWAWRQ
jgi:hypothetical protein